MSKMELVRACHDDVLKEISDSYIEDRTAHVSDIINDWKCCAAEEWEDLTVEEADEEFDRLYKIIEDESTKLAMAYA